MNRRTFLQSAGAATMALQTFSLLGATSPTRRYRTALIGSGWWGIGMLSLKAGRSIVWDGKKEIIVGDKEANALLKREYRKSWVYPSSKDSK